MMVLLYLVRHTLQILTIESKWDIVVACPLNGDQTFSSFGTSTSVTNSHPLANSKLILMCILFTWYLIVENRFSFLLPYSILIIINHVYYILCLCHKYKSLVKISHFLMH